MNTPALARLLKRTHTVTLIRHLKSGKDVQTPGLTPRKAIAYAGLLLRDCAGVSKQEAQTWAAALPLGQRIDHESGYGVTITKDELDPDGTQA